MPSCLQLWFFKLKVALYTGRDHFPGSWLGLHFANPQPCVFGSGFNLDLVWSMDPDPGRLKRFLEKEKPGKISCFEELSEKLRPVLGAWTSFIKTLGLAVIGPGSQTQWIRIRNPSPSQCVAKPTFIKPCRPIRSNENLQNIRRYISLLNGRRSV